MGAPVLRKDWSFRQGERELAAIPARFPKELLAPGGPQAGPCLYPQLGCPALGTPPELLPCRRTQGLQPWLGGNVLTTA